MANKNKDGFQVEIVVRKRPKPQPYAKKLKNGVIKLIYEVTQEEMDATVERMVNQEQRRLVPTNDKAQDAQPLPHPTNQ